MIWVFCRHPKARENPAAAVAAALKLPVPEPPAASSGRAGKRKKKGEEPPLPPAEAEQDASPEGAFLRLVQVRAGATKSQNELHRPLPCVSSSLCPPQSCDC